MRQSQAQQRAAAAREALLEACGNPDLDRKKLRSYARSLPPMIVMNGLGQAAAFCRSKGQSEAAYGALYQLLSDWLTREENPYAGAEDLLEAVTGQDLRHYRKAQLEALAFLHWVKLFAEVLLVAPAKDEEEGKAAEAEPEPAAEPGSEDPA